MQQSTELPQSIVQKLRENSGLVEKHRSQGHVSLSGFLENRSANIGRQVLSRHRIYLDQRFWIECRDAEFGSRNTCQKKEEIWDQLKKAVDSGRAWCPMHAPLFCETLKQHSDLRVQTSQIIDRLCGGFVIENSLRRCGIELDHWTRAALLEEHKLLPVRYSVWTTAGSVLGTPIPVPGSSGDEFDEAVQKAFVELLDSFGFQEYFHMYHEQEVPPSGENDSAFQSYQTLMSKNTKRLHATYSSVFETEVRGALSLLSQDFSVLARSLWGKGVFSCLNEDAVHDAEELATDLRALLHAGLVTNKITTELPFLHLHSTLHAVIRHTGQLFRKGDTYDFEHAAAALPYCDTFITEKKLANLLRKQPYCLDKQYGCVVLSDRGEIIQYLRRLNSGDL